MDGLVVQQHVDQAPGPGLGNVALNKKSGMLYFLGTELYQSCNYLHQIFVRYRNILKKSFILKILNNLKFTFSTDELKR